MHMKIKGEEEGEEKALERDMRLLRLVAHLARLCTCTHSCIQGMHPLLLKCRQTAHMSAPLFILWGERQANLRGLTRHEPLCRETEIGLPPHS